MLGNLRTNRERQAAIQPYPGLEIPRVGPYGRRSMNCRLIIGLFSAAAISIVLAGGASAQDKQQDKTVKIGGIYPLSGNAASTGVHTKAAFETAIEIINNAHPELGNLPLAK